MSAGFIRAIEATPFDIFNSIKYHIAAEVFVCAVVTALFAVTCFFCVSSSRRLFRRPCPCISCQPPAVTATVSAGAPPRSSAPSRSTSPVIVPRT
jgi:hypothetical protein